MLQLQTQMKYALIFQFMQALLHKEYGKLYAHHMRGLPEFHLLGKRHPTLSIGKHIGKGQAKLWWDFKINCVGIII